MSWFRLDDGFDNHPKILNVGNAAAGLYVRCGAYIARHLTDGLIPSEITRQYGNQRLISLLVKERLWIPVEGGYIMRDYLDYNLSRVQVEAERKAAAERQKRFREKEKGNAVTHGTTNAVTDGVRNGVTNGVTEGTVTRDERRESRHESQDPILSNPLKAPGETSKGGVTKATREDQKPPRNDLRCQQHKTLPPDDPGPPCRACRDVRVAAENAAEGAVYRAKVDASDAKRRFRETLNDCPACDEYGWELDTDGAPCVPARKCTHPLRRVS